jgi:hypothetical protein
MIEYKSVNGTMAGGVGRLFLHGISAVVGVLLMIVGLAMGVSVVLLPLSIPVGFVGLLAFLWGLFGFSPEQPTTIPPADRK